jgi:hypothetical protein
MASHEKILCQTTYPCATLKKMPLAAYLRCGQLEIQFQKSNVMSVPVHLMNFSICVKFMDAMSALVKESHYNYNYYDIRFTH